MSESKHTPGPWRIVKTARKPWMKRPRWRIHATNTNRGRRGHSLSFVGVATVHQSDADANLIAAAPDLLAALRKFVTAAKSWHDFHHGSDTIQCDWLCECIEPGEKALAKAEGRSDE